MNLLFAWRYFRAKKSTNAINIIAWVAVSAIIVISAAFIVLLSVFNGFEGLVKSLYSSFYADMRIIPAEGKKISFTGNQLAELKNINGVLDYSLVIEERTLLRYGESQTIVNLKGVDERYSYVTNVPAAVVRGEFNTGDSDMPGLVLGSGVENALGLISDRSLFPVTAYLFRPGVNVNVVDPMQAFSAENIQPTGTFFIQQDIDNAYALTDVRFMQKMMNMAEDEFGGLEINLSDEVNPDKIKNTIQNLFGKEYLVETRYEQNRSLFNIMTMEKWATYGVLTLMLIVASFTMIGALSMLVLEKKKDIQVLKSLGATNSLIRRIFITEGFLLGFIGCVVGLSVGLLICWLQEEYQLVGIAGGSFLINHYPVLVKYSDLIMIFITVISIAILASWFPAYRAAKARIMNYE